MGSNPMAGRWSNISSGRICHSAGCRQCRRLRGTSYSTTWVVGCMPVLTYLPYGPRSVEAKKYRVDACTCLVQQVRANIRKGMCIRTPCPPLFPVRLPLSNLKY